MTIRLTSGKISVPIAGTLIFCASNVRAGRYGHAGPVVRPAKLRSGADEVRNGECSLCEQAEGYTGKRERKMYGDIIILSGAGISAESGIPTFRDSDGLWNNHRIEEVATIEAYRRNPEAVHDFYNNLKTDLQKAEPNPAHLAITRLQNEYKNGTVSVVTQNVDLLHEKAGNRNVYHIHGQIDQAVCMNCGRVITTWGEVTTETVCPGCGVPAMMKPNIVFFGENLLRMNEVDALLDKCRLLIAVGTSGAVYPANTFARIAKYHGADTVELNLRTTVNNYDFDRHIVGRAGETLPVFVDELLAEN